MKKKIIILGATGGCLDLVNLIEDINKNQKEKQFEISGFLDDRIKSKKIKGINILGKFKDIKNFKKTHYFTTAIGNSANFKGNVKIIKNLNISKNRFATLIHPNSYISKSAKLGFGCVIFQNVTLSTNVLIGDFVQILPNTIINHDSKIGNFTKINSNCNISGNVQIQNSCYIGAGVIMRENIKINKFNIIGIGSLVLKNIDFTNSKIFGHPAKKNK